VQKRFHDTHTASSIYLQILIDDLEQQLLSDFHHDIFLAQKSFKKAQMIYFYFLVNINEKPTQLQSAKIDSLGHALMFHCSLVGGRLQPHLTTIRTGLSVGHLFLKIEVLFVFIIASFYHNVTNKIFDAASS
jgi:hypothetical protein